jgi:MFS family permease
MTLPQEALSIPNVRRFVRFRIFFNARYYYPIFTILFLDFGLTLEQFALLNALWSITIVLAEVPSGALADIIGRRNLLRTGAVLMVLEMLVLLFAPVGGGALTLALFALNRIFSGLAEAMVSGADEALAFESMKEKGTEEAWPEVLEHVGKRMSVTMAIVMVTGAVVYDANSINRAIAWLGLDLTLAETLLHRIPVALTLIHAVIVAITTWQMREPASGTDPIPFSARRLGESFVRIGEAGKWLLNNRFLLFVVLGGLILDSTARQMVIFNSEYYRHIRIPEIAFGFISAGMAAFGFFIARFNRYLARNQTPFRNLLILSAILTATLVGVQFVIPYAGVLFMPGIFIMFSAVAFLQSHYINREVASDQRATILSFRGLANNLGLGAASLFYTLLIGILKSNHPSLDGAALQDTVFVEALSWFPGYYLALLTIVLITGRLFIRRREKCFQEG